MHVSDVVPDPDLKRLHNNHIHQPDDKHWCCQNTFRQVTSKLTVDRTVICTTVF